MTDQANPWGLSVQTMTSREIADITGKQHKHVLRDIRVMIGQLSTSPKLDQLEWYCVSERYTDAKGESREQYRLDRNTTLNLIAGYDPVLRMHIINRWDELERHHPALDFSKLNTTILTLATAVQDLTTQLVDCCASKQQPKQDRHSQPKLQALVPEVQFLSAWRDCLGTRDVTANDLYRIISSQQCPALLQAAEELFGPTESWTGRRLGNALRTWSRHSVDGFLIINLGKAKGGIIWRLERTQS